MPYTGIGRALPADGRLGFVCLDVKSCVIGRRRAAGSDAWHPDPRLQRDQRCSGRIKNRDTFE